MYTELDNSAFGLELCADLKDAVRFNNWCNFDGLKVLRDVMIENGEIQKPIWMTEFGFALDYLDKSHYCPKETDQILPYPIFTSDIENLQAERVDSYLQLVGLLGGYIEKFLFIN